MSSTHDLHAARLRKRAVLAVAVAAIFVASGTSMAIDIGGMFKSKFESIGQAARSGEWDAYITGYAWHVPWAYQESTRSRLNETTWGGGFGRTLIDDDGDRHSVYMMAFADSHRAPQFTAGYGWHRYWSPRTQTGLGYGYMAFLFSREDVAHHLPLPAILPVLSWRYRSFEILGLYVPKVSKDIKGDVLFLFMRLPLGADHGRIKRASSPPGFLPRGG